MARYSDLKPPPSPGWLRYLIMTFVVATFACLITAAIVGLTGPKKPSILYKCLVCSGMICLGLTIEAAMFALTKGGEIYSGISRRTISVQTDPIQFRCILSFIALLALSLIVYMVWLICHF